MKLIRLPEVSTRSGKTRSRIYADIQDGTFPRPVKTGNRTVAWVEAEVDDWIAARVEERDRAA